MNLGIEQILERQLNAATERDELDASSLVGEDYNDDNLEIQVESLENVEDNEEAENYASSSESIASLLQKLINAGLRYSDCSGQKITIKCKSLDSKSGFRYKHQPNDKTTKKLKAAASTSATAKTLKPVTASSATTKTLKPVTASIASTTPSHPQPVQRRTNSAELKALKEFIIKNCGQDLDARKLKSIPHHHINMIGWPVDYPMKLNQLSIEQLQRIANMIRTGQVRFEWKN